MEKVSAFRKRIAEIAKGRGNLVPGVKLKPSSIEIVPVKNKITSSKEVLHDSDDDDYDSDVPLRDI